jgi:DNA-binding CsgD family transcriptional regulator
MARDRVTLPGRNAELSDLDNALAGTDTARHSLTVVRGTPGIGKTALLTVAENRWRRSGVTVLPICFRDAVQPWDSYGVRATVKALRAHFEPLGDPAPTDSLNAVSRACVPGVYDSPRGRSGLLIALARIFRRISASGPVVVVADDLDAVPNPTLALAPACLPGYLVVAACRDDGRLEAAPMQLAPLADQLIDLGPLPVDCAGTLLAQRIGTFADDSLLAAVHGALGPLANSPGTLLSTVDSLRNDGRIVTVHGRACLTAGAPIALPARHDLVGQVRRLGAAGRDLMTMAGTSGSFGVDDLLLLAAATGHDVADYGRAVDTLVRVGALVSAESGQLSSACPALAEAVLAEAAEPAAQLHRELADHLFATGGAAAQIADHVAAAGSELPPSKDLARLLAAEADRAAETDSGRAARWYQAALRHAGNEGPDRAHLLSALVEVLVRSGNYAWLNAVLGKFAADVATGDHARLAAAAALAALHTATPVPDQVRAALAGGGAALRWCDRWFAGDAVDPADLLSACSTLARQPSVNPVPERHDEPAADLAALLEIGAGAGIPDAGPLAHQHRVAAGYAKGEWHAALSAARELELTRPPDRPAIPAHQLGSLLAADICAGQGNLKQAAAWLDTVGADDRFVALRGWAESGMLAADSDTAQALAVGWWAYRRVHADRRQPGRERLLRRLATIAICGGHPDRARAVLVEMADLNDREHTRASHEGLLYVRGIVTGDEADVRASADSARYRGHLPDLLLACFALGELSAEPQPWLHEAHRLAKQFGSPPARTRARTLMRSRGVSMPRSEDGRSALSEMELRIVDLIRDGRTNRQVAIALRITEKTVEYYLSRLFGKTGCRSRVDLVAASVRGQLAAVSA